MEAFHPSCLTLRCVYPHIREKEIKNCKVVCYQVHISNLAASRCQHQNSDSDEGLWAQVAGGPSFHKAHQSLHKKTVELTSAWTHTLSGES